MVKQLRIFKRKKAGRPRKALKPSKVTKKKSI